MSKKKAPKKTREKIFSVTLKDCEVQTFRAGGKGGQAQNKLETGVRVIHRESGARGEARDSRSQFDNKRAAFKRMAESPKFQLWARMTASDIPSIDELVDEQMQPKNLKVEYFDPEEE